MQICSSNSGRAEFSGPRKLGLFVLCGIVLQGLSGCSFMTAAGPSSRAVNNIARQGDAENASIRIIDVNDAVAHRLLANSRMSTFSEVFGSGVPITEKIGRGDVLEVAIWEAPPAALFGSMGGDVRLSASSSSIARGTSLPEQMVDRNGMIAIPFAGNIAAAGRTPQEIQQDIERRLRGKAHEPQVVVRLVRNVAANVTIVGDVMTSALLPLTSRGERLLDAIASAGGVKQPVGKTTIQLSRNGRVQSMALEAVIRDPQQNVRLEAEDVITVLFQPFSFTALGATGTNAEIPFEGTGISLAQALGRVGGVQDNRADAKGVFIFRLEDVAALDLADPNSVRTTMAGKVPVIYRVDLKNPSTLFTAQSFPVRNGDVIYVSNAPLADMQKFVNIVASLIYPVISVQNSLNN